jgi:hypothetical protein
VNKEALDKVVEFVSQDRLQANSSIINSLDDDPEQAAEAVRLGKVTGDDPVLINVDLEDYKRQQKVQLSTNLLDSNEYMRDFIRSSPMAPKLVHDDIGPLDKLTSNIGKTFIDAGLRAINPFYGLYRASSRLSGGPGPIERGFVTTMAQQNPELTAEFLEGASHGTPDIIRRGMLSGSQSLRSLASMSPEEFKRQNESFFEIGGPLDALSWAGEVFGSAVGSAAIPMGAGAIGAAAGIPGGPPGMAAGAFIGAASTSYIMNYGEVYQALKKAGVDPVMAGQYAAIAATPMAALDVTGVGVIANRFMKAAAKKEFTDTFVKRIVKEIGIGAVTEGGTEGAQEIIKDLAVSIAADKGFMTKENAKGWIEATLAGAIGGGGMTAGAAFVGAHKAAPYINEGKDVPAGLDATMDKLKLAIAQNDLEKIDSLLKDAKESALRERSPEHMSELLRQQIGNTGFEISTAAIQKLYGDKQITADDGLLGWVPDLAEQMKAEHPGGFVTINVRDWLANVSDDVELALHDDILTRPSGVTINEGKLAAKVQAQTQAAEPTPAVAERTTVEDRGKGGFFVRSTGDPNDLLSVLVGPEAVHASVATVGRATRGTGVGVALYERAVQFAAEQGLPLRSDMAVSADAINVYEALRRRGYQITEAPGTTTTAAGKTNAIAGYVYEVRPPALVEAVKAEPVANEIIQRNGQAIASVREAASLGVMIDLGPQAEYMLFENRLRMQAILDRLSRAEKPEEIATLRQELANVGQTLRARGWEVAEPGPPEVPGPPGWISAKQPPEVSISFVKGGVKFELDVKPIASDTLQDVMDQFDFSPISAFGSFLKPITDRILSLASNIPVHVVSDADFAKLFDAAGVARKPRGFHTTYTLFGDHIVFPSSVFHGNRNVLARLVFHEAIHAATSRALYDNPIMTRTVKTLMDSLEADNPELKNQYGYKNVHEFLAEALSNREFQDLLGAMQLSEQMARSLGMEEWTGRTVWQALVESIRRALNIPEGAFSALEGALRVTELVMGAQEVALAQREARVAKVRSKEAESLGAPPKQLEMHGVTRQEDLDIFEEARLIGLTIDQYALMMQKIAERNASDTAMLLKKVEKFVRKKLTKEWKEAQTAMRAEVEETLLARPDIALATYFRTGRLYGEQQGIPKINRNALTPEQRKNIPDRWQSERGMAPEDAAHIVGYSSVDQMALRAALLEKNMVAAKQPSLKKYVDGLVKAETERRMIKEHGNLEENITKEAMEHVVSPIQMDLLHEDTVAMGMKHGWTMPFTKAEIVKGVKATFGQLKAAKVSMEKFLRDSGKAGKLSGIAELEENSTEFFKQRQNQEYAIRKAAEAKVLEKEQTSFENTAKLMGQKKSLSVDETHFAYIQELLHKAGLPVKNTQEEVAKTIDYFGHGSLDQYIEYMKGAYGGDLELFVPRNYTPKPFEDMTVAEFREFKEAIDGMRGAGIRLKKHNDMGELMDFENFKGTIISHFRKLREKPRVAPEGKKKKGFWLWRIDAPWTRMEEIVKDLDLREELGPLWRALIGSHAMAKSDEFTMTEELSKKFKEMKGGNKKWWKTLSDDIPQDFIFDDYNGVYLKMTRWNLIRMMLNVGNESNKNKLARGIASADPKIRRIATGEETQAAMNNIDALINKHATLEDWEFVQNIWDIFEGWTEKQERVVRATSGKMPKWIEATPITVRIKDSKTGAITAHEFAGGYIPLIEDKIRLQDIKKGMPEVRTDALMGPDYHRASTSRPHHLERTGAVYFVDITNGIENLAGRMQQHIHDMAFREFVMDAGKIIYDKEIMNEITKYYGVEYAEQFKPWLNRIANSLTVEEKELQWLNDALRHFRLALTVAAIPLNYAVMYSPTLGTANVKVLAALRSETKADRERILANSEELKHVLYTIDRDLTDTLSHITGGRGIYAKWSSFQRRAAEIMLSPLVWFEGHTRSVTFYGEFMAQKEKGLSDQEAAAWADSIVRERHGAVSPGDLPAILAKNSEAWKLATLFLGWFTMNRNWQRQIPGQIRRGDYAGLAKTVWGTVIIAALFNAVLFTKRRESDTLWSYLARAVLDVPLAGVPYVRDVWGYVSEGRRATSPLVGWAINTGDLLKDGYKSWMGGPPVKRPIRRTISALAGVVPIPGAVQIARTGEFGVDIVTEHQRPRDIIEWIRGLHQGEARLRK